MQMPTDLERPDYYHFTSQPREEMTCRHTDCYLPHFNNRFNTYWTPQGLNGSDVELGEVTRAGVADVLKPSYALM